MLPPPPAPPPSLSPGDETAAPGSTVGEAFAIAPDTYVVPGWWPFPGTGLGLPFGTLVVRGRATAVIDTAPRALEDDWLAAVLALVDPDEVRWIVATGADGVRAGCVGALHALAPRATLVVPGRSCPALDLGDGRAVQVTEVPAGGGIPTRLVAEVRERRLLWTDLVGGTFAGPVRDVAAAADDVLLAGLARRPRPLAPGELDDVAGRDLRLLGSPMGPIARGPGIARALDLARLAEPLRTAVEPALGALLAPLGPPPPTGATVAG